MVVAADVGVEQKRRFSEGYNPPLSWYVTLYRPSLG